MRFGIDLGGTKIEIAALTPDGAIAHRERVQTPRDQYDNTIRTIRDLVLAAESKLGIKGSLGVGTPGALSLKTGLIKNANNTDLIGHPLDKDLAKELGRAVRVANDANCFTLSEASDGAGAQGHVVFGIIAGTGVGGGITVDKTVINGAHAITGEWGHNPLPAAGPDEKLTGPKCYCGKASCIETWCSGPAFEREYKTASGNALGAANIVALADKGDAVAQKVLSQLIDRFARSIASVVNILDPDAIVIGGGMSNIDAFYRQLPDLVAQYAFTTEGPVNVLKNMHGDSSGVRGAAWLWQEGDKAGLPP
ncbi:MAG TPA: ROK family protein [Rhizomicrobium sp.]